MATDQYSGGGITVTTYAGPKDGDEPRRRVQLAVGSEYVQMSMAQWSLLCAVTDMLGTNCRGYHIGREDGV